MIFSVHRKFPTIVVDFQELVKIVECINKLELMLGGRFQRMNQFVDYFFGEIKKCNAKLIFIANFNEDRFQKITRLHGLHTKLGYSTIAGRGSLQPSLLPKDKFDPASANPTERIQYNLLQICSKYGEINGNYDSSTKAILAYTRDNRNNVMAVMTRNTEYFIYDVNFEYWNLSDIELEAVKITKFCRKKLNEVHGLNYRQMQLLFVISEVNKLEPMDFPELVEYIKQQNIGPNSYDLTDKGMITMLRPIIDKQFSEVKDTANFSGGWPTNIHNSFVAGLVATDVEFETMLRFFKKEIPFAYKLINEDTSGPSDMIFINIHGNRMCQFIDVVSKITLKLIGIVFKDVKPEKRPKTRIMKFNRDVFTVPPEHVMKIIYPTSE